MEGGIIVNLAPLDKCVRFSFGLENRRIKSESFVLVYTLRMLLFNILHNNSSGNCIFSYVCIGINTCMYRMLNVKCYSPIYLKKIMYM